MIINSRSPEIGVSIVKNKSGWYINISMERTPYKMLGPYDNEMTLPEALQLVAVEMKLTQAGEKP